MNQALNASGTVYTDGDVQHVFRESGTSRFYNLGKKYHGKIATTKHHNRRAADLIDYTAEPKGNYTHILCGRSIFSQRMLAKPLTGTTPGEVTVAFKSIAQKAGIPE